MAGARLSWRVKFAASSLVVFSTAFGSQASTRSDRELLASADRKVGLFLTHKV